MNFKKTLQDALYYPLTSAKNFLILFILISFSPSIGFSSFTSDQSMISSTLEIILIPLMILTYGYQIRTIKSTLSGSKQMPDFKEGKEMFMDGLRSIVVTLAYFIPVFPLIIILIIIVQPHDVFSTILLNYLILIMAEFLVAIPAFMGLGNMAHHKKIGAAFQIRKILNLIKNAGWISYLSYIFICTMIPAILYLIVDIMILTGVLKSIATFSEVIVAIAYSLIIGLITTYILAFEGRLIGTIYSLAKEKSENENLIKE